MGGHRACRVPELGTGALGQRCGRPASTRRLRRGTRLRGPMGPGRRPARAHPVDGAGRTGRRRRADLATPGPVVQWRSAAATIRTAILEESWDDDAQTLCERLGGRGVDASLLALPLRQVVPADHPRMVATTRAIVDRLDAGGGLLYRYRHDDSPDGIAGDEGAFLLCSFWLVDNLVGQGRLAEAEELYTSLCGRASPLGLL